MATSIIEFKAGMSSVTFNSVPQAGELLIGFSRTSTGNNAIEDWSFGDGRDWTIRRWVQDSSSIFMFWRFADENESATLSYNHPNGDRRPVIYRVAGANSINPIGVISNSYVKSLSDPIGLDMDPIVVQAGSVVFFQMTFWLLSSGGLAIKPDTGFAINYSNFRTAIGSSVVFETEQDVSTGFTIPTLPEQNRMSGLLVEVLASPGPHIGKKFDITQYEADAVIPIGDFGEPITEILINDISCEIVSQNAVGVVIKSVPGHFEDGEVTITAISQNHQANGVAEYTRTHHVLCPGVGESNTYSARSALAGAGTSFMTESYINMPYMFTQVGGEGLTFTPTFRNGDGWTTENLMLPIDAVIQTPEGMVGTFIGQMQIKQPDGTILDGDVTLNVSSSASEVTIDIRLIDDTGTPVSETEIEWVQRSGWGGPVVANGTASTDGSGGLDVTEGQNQWLFYKHTNGNWGGFVSPNNTSSGYQIPGYEPPPFALAPQTVSILSRSWDELDFEPDARAWRVDEGQYLQRNMDMDVVYPRPDEETNPTYAYHRVSHPDMEYRVRIRLRFGSWPYRFVIERDDTNEATIGKILIDDDYATLVVPAGVMQQGQTYTFRVVAYDQQFARDENPSYPLDIEWSCLCDADAFVFVGQGSSGGSGTHDDPFLSSNLSVLDTNIYQSKRVVLLEGDYTLPRVGASTWSFSTMQRTLVSYPGHDVSINCQGLHRFTATTDSFVGDILFYNNQEYVHDTNNGGIRTSFFGILGDRVTFEGTRFKASTGGANGGGSNSAAIRSDQMSGYREHISIGGVQLDCDGHTLPLINFYNISKFVIEESKITNFVQQTGDGQMLLFKASSILGTVRRVESVDGANASTGMINNYAGDNSGYSQDRIEFVFNRHRADNPSNISLYTIMSNKSLGSTYWFGRNTVTGRISGLSYQVTTYVTNNLLVTGHAEPIKESSGALVVHNVDNVVLDPSTSPLDVNGKLVGQFATQYRGTHGADLGGIYTGY